MISAQCNELRAMAMSVEMEIPQAATLMMGAADTIDRLDAENAKLRELVHELWEGYNDPPCEDCPLKDKLACADCPICAREAEVIDRMRELGIEV